MLNEDFWTGNRLAGLVLSLGVLLPLIPSLGVLVFGNVRAAEAMFSDLEHAVGHVTSFRIMAAGWGVFMLISLAGFLLFAFTLWEEGTRPLVVLAATAVTLHTVFVTLEVSFHISVMAWAIRELEEGTQVPEFVLQMRHWFNFWLQVFSNPLLLLAYIGFGIAILKTGAHWPWMEWTMIIWGGAFLVFPLPLLIYPLPILLAVTLLLRG